MPGGISTGLLRRHFVAKLPLCGNVKLKNKGHMVLLNNNLKAYFSLQR